ncbi:hypothetical protein [Pseudomonas sp. o96-267]|uniref:hypothetical protein n=1 Tax=Pseudomonas sp. o96-267 TaxID=2479853 RepID=UPI000F7B1687|nr:hypothetical protein [Pseudomonas sp. o96-267]
MSTHMAPSSRQTGQAMAEFVVMTAGCLLLMFVLIPLIAKLSDMSYKAQETARYSAWERTVWYQVNGDDSNTPRQIDTRDGYLATRSDDDVLKSAERRLLGFEQAAATFSPQDIDGSASNNFWRWTHSANGNDMMAPASMSSASELGSSATPSFAYSIVDTYNDVMGGIASILSIFSFGGGDDDYLQIAHPTRNFYRAEVNIPVAMTGSQLGSKPLFGQRLSQLNVGARSAVLADGWVAQSESHFDEKVDDFVLGTLIEENPIFDTVRTIIGIFEPSFRTLNLAPVNTDPLPEGEVNCNPTSGFCDFK